jgi:cell division protein FtsZ
MVSQAVHPDANIIFGATIDDALGDEVRVTVIAAGFDGGRPKKREDAPALRPPRPMPPLTPNNTGASPTTSGPAAPASASGPAQPRQAPVYGGDDDLDVPDFLK